MVDDFISQSEFREFIMNIRLGIISVLAITTGLSACGGGGGGGAGGGGGGAGGNGQYVDTNPLAGGGVLSQATTLYSGGGIEQELVLNLDPINKSFSYRFSTGGTVVSGPYDPSTGRLEAKNCESEYDYFCEDVVGQVGFIKADDFSGSGLVLLDESNMTYWGVSPTAIADMPMSGQPVEYTGRFVAIASYYDAAQGEFVDSEIDGKAVTIVDFDEGKVDADFTNIEGDFEGASAHLDGAAIDGNNFEGGVFRTVSPDGDVVRDDEPSVFGHFFGSEAQELGGSIYSYGPDLELDGAWSGKAE